MRILVFDFGVSSAYLKATILPLTPRQTSLLQVLNCEPEWSGRGGGETVSYTHLRAHETEADL
eukprot:1042362-Rhodomonas_salina.1